MTDARSICLRVWPAEGAEPQEIALPLAGPGARCTLRLRCLPGASGVHLVLTDETGPLLRAELPANSGETVVVQAGLEEDGTPRLWSGDQPVISLPVDEQYAPPPPILPAPAGGALDVALVVDGTLVGAVVEGTVRQPSPEQRQTHAAALLDLVERLAVGRPDCRTTLVAFGDQAPAQVVAKSLIPDYHLWPLREEERSLRAFDRGRLARQLERVPPTSGGDFVDALADALDAVARLRWRPEARKLVVMSGDSPGHSVLYPLPRGASVGVRQRNVDSEALRLFRAGIEVATMYHPPPADDRLYDLEYQRQLLSAAEEQYARLASLTAYAFRFPDFDPAAAAEAIAGNERPIGRDASLAELVEVTAGPRQRREEAPAYRAAAASEDVELPVE